MMNKYDTPCPRCEDFGRRLTNAENELYMAHADKSQTLMEAERAMAQIREATAKVVAERDAAVADAARYRWLREQTWEKSRLCVVQNPAKAVRLGYICPSVEYLDAAIDAARKEGHETVHDTRRQRRE